MLLSLESKESRFVGAWEANISIYYRSNLLQNLQVGLLGVFIEMERIYLAMNLLVVWMELQRDKEIILELFFNDYSCSKIGQEASSFFRQKQAYTHIKTPLIISQYKHMYLSQPQPQIIPDPYPKRLVIVSSIFLDDKIKQYRMGCSSPQNAGIPNIPAQHLNRLLQVSDIHHQLNVNKKYQHLSKVREGMTVGQGFKKTFAYDCLTTAEEMKSKRKEFWETRVNGSPECWGAIRLAVQEPDQETGNRILQELRIGMLNNNIQMCVDTKFNKYEVPIFCINQPISYAQENLAEKNMNFDYSDENMQVKVRSVRFPTQDITLTLKTSTEVGQAKIQLRTAKQIPDSEAIRFFYNGREMIDSKTLGNYSYAVGTIIQAMIR